MSDDDFAPFRGGYEVGFKDGQAALIAELRAWANFSRAVRRRDGWEAYLSGHGDARRELLEVLDQWEQARSDG